MTTSTASTPKYLLQQLNALNADGLGIHSVVDVEASASGEILRAETIVQLADHEQVDAKGRIHPLQAALLARAFPQEFFYLPTIPAALQQAIARPLAALARSRGYSADPAGLADLTAPIVP
jgi:hypothetical protein